MYVLTTRRILETVTACPFLLRSRLNSGEENFISTFAAVRSLYCVTQVCYAHQSCVLITLRD